MRVVEKHYKTPSSSLPTSFNMMKLVIFVGVLAACALSATVVSVDKRAELETLEKRGNDTDCFVCPSYRDWWNPPCYPYHWFCDGYKDCPSGIDEAETYCGERVRHLDEILEDIAENLGYAAENIVEKIFTDDYPIFEEVYEETRKAMEKISDVVEEAVDDNF